MLKLLRIMSLGLAFLFAVAPQAMALSHVGTFNFPMGSCTIKISSTSSNQQAQVTLGNLAAAGYIYTGGSRNAHSPITAADVGACFPNPHGVQHFTPANPQNGWAGEDYLGFTFFYGALKYEYALSGASGTAVLSGAVTPGGAVAPHITLGPLTRNFNGTYSSQIKLTKPAGNGTSFVASDLTLQNATATLSGSGLSYTATLTQTVPNSSLSLSVAAGVFTDAAGNNNLAARAVHVRTDFTQPSVTLGAIETTPTNGVYRSVITLSEPVGNGTSFVVGDLSAAKANVTLAQSSSTVYIATLTPSPVGQTMSLTVGAGVFSDAAGNTNLASNTVSFSTDTAGPGVTIRQHRFIPGFGNTFSYFIIFSEAAGLGTSLDVSELVITNADVVSYSSNSRSASLTLRPNPHDSMMTVFVPAGVFTDANGNPNQASLIDSRNTDFTSPLILMEPLARQSDGTYASVITLSEPAGNGTVFEASDLTVTNASATLSGSGTTYTATLTPNPAETIISLSIARGAFSDAAGQVNLIGNHHLPPFTVSANTDISSPVVTLGALARQANGTYTSAISLSEEVGNGTVFEASDLSVTSANVTLTGSGTSYTATLTPTPAETIISLAVGAGEFTDAAGNGNLAASVISANTDVSSPVVTLGPLTRQADRSYKSAITLSEPPGNGSALELSDLGVTNAIAFLSGSGTSYTVVLNPLASGEIKLSVPTAAFTDAAGNNNTTSNEVTSIVDLTPPTVSIAAFTGPANGAQSAAITLSEPSTNFTLTDLTLTNATATLSGSGTNYTAVLTPALSGEVKLSVAEKTFTDAAGNDNTASNEISSTVDLVAPTVSIAAFTGPANGAQSAAITLSEPSTNFTLSDLTLTNATATLSGSGTNYTAVLTPALSGEVKLSVAEKTFTDAAGNDNTASNEVAVTYDGTLPTVVLSTAAINVSGISSFDVTIEFSENVAGFNTDDLNVTNGSVTNLLGSSAIYTAIITSSGEGATEISVAANVAVDDAGNGNIASNVLSIENTAVEDTQRLIADFMTTRANQLVSNQPDLTSFLLGETRGGFNAQVTRGAFNFALASQPNRPVWFQLQASRTDAVGTINDYLLGAIGSHRQIGENTLLGAILEFDHVSRSDGVSRISGSGWLVGPYFVTRLPNQPLYFEGRLLWGKTHNRISPFGTYTDSFSTERALVQFKVSGQMIHGETTLIPSLGASYTTDRQNLYTDSLGNIIQEQEIQLGQVALGFDLSTPFKVGNQTWKLDAGIQGLYTTTKGSGTASLVASSVEGARARINVKASTELKNGGHFFVGGHYDGIGDKDFEGFGVELGMKVKF
jgi:hypothetical protein